MKRTGNLIPQIAEYENLLAACYKAQKGKLHKPGVFEYSKNLEQNLRTLQIQILTGNIEVGNYHYFTVYDPKERQICAASYPERILHHAIMNICAPYFEKFQIYHSYATRANKGTFRAVDQAWQNQKRYRYYLKLDIRKYFDSINHSLLLGMLSRVFKDKGLLSLFSKIVESYSVAPNNGIPIGNLTSQYFANFYLAYCDHFILEQLKVCGHVRYMDDFVVWSNDIVHLKEAKSKIEHFVADKLSLELKTSFINKCEHGLNFLGFRLFPNRKLLSKRSKVRFKRKQVALYSELFCKKISQEVFQVHSTALNAFAAKAYSKSLRRKILQQYESVIN